MVRKLLTAVVPSILLIVTMSLPVAVGTGEALADEFQLLAVSYRAAESGKPGYVGRFKQYHKKSNKLGVGSVVLIAPSWAVTAGHVVAFKLKNPNGGKSEVLFAGSKVERLGTKIHKAKGVDLALLQLERPIGTKSVKPVAVMASGFTAKDGRVKFTSIGRSGVHRGRYGHGTGEGFSHSKGKDGTRPGKAGDSGGAWVVERDKGKPDVLFAIIHGGGRGPQLGPLKQWVDTVVQRNGEKVLWVAKSEVKPAATK